MMRRVFGRNGSVWRNGFNEIVIQSGDRSVTILPSELKDLIKVLQEEAQ